MKIMFALVATLALVALTINVGAAYAQTTCSDGYYSHKNGAEACAQHGGEHKAKQ